MEPPGPLASGRQGDIDPLGGKPLRQLLSHQRGLARLDGVPHPVFGPVDLLPRRAPLLRRQAAQSLETLGDQPLLAQVAHPRRVQGPGVSRRRHLAQGLLQQILQVIHGAASLRAATGRRAGPSDRFFFTRSP